MSSTSFSFPRPLSFPLLQKFRHLPHPIIPFFLPLTLTPSKLNVILLRPLSLQANLSSVPLLSLLSPQSLFHVYNTPSYALHLFEAPTGLEFILLTSPGLDSKIVRSALRMTWGPNGAYGLWVVGNPEKGSGKEGKEGLDSE